LGVTPPFPRLFLTAGVSRFSGQLKALLMNLSSFLTKPLAIGAKKIDSRLIMAPLSGIATVALRQVADSFGGFGLYYAGMASASAVPTEKPEVSFVFRWRSQELPRLVCQIFGSNPSVMARAAARIEAEGFFGVDLNFGCAVSAITRNGAGAALLKDLSAARQVVTQVRKAVAIPLIIKYRTGWKDDPKYAQEMALRFEEWGADALIFHPRVAPDKRTRPPKWEYIACVKQAVTIPVFGNGNVFSQADCARMISLTGCDGVALGRIAAARPFCAARWLAGQEAAPADYSKTAAMLCKSLTEHFGPPHDFSHLKKISPYFCANFLYGHGLDKKIRYAKNMEQACRIFEDFFLEDPPVNGLPNPHLFN